jgi:hypothetical protein
MRILEREYLPEHNRRFARAATRPEDYHRRAPGATELDKIFRLESVRTISEDWVVRYDNRFFQLERQSRHYAPAKGQVVVCQAQHRSLAIEYRGRALRWQEIPPPARPRGEKAGAAGHLGVVPAPRLAKRKWAPPADHPWRRAARPAAEKLDQNVSGGMPVATRPSLALPCASP